MFEKEYDIAMYGSGPATIFLANKLQQLNIKIIIIEMGDIDNVNKFETIDKTKGPIQFHHQNNKERASSFFGTASLWKQPGVGGKLQKFDAIDINNKWPIKFEELNLKYNEIINELSSHVNIKEDYTNINDHINLTEFNKFFKFKYDSSRLTFKFSKIYRIYKKKILNSKNIFFLSNTQLLNFDYSVEKKKVNHAVCVSHDNKKFNINAKHHILSLGCLESNRIILNTFKNETKFLENYKFGEGLTFHPSMNLGAYDLEADFKIKDFCKNFDPKNRIIFFKQNDQTKLKGMNSAISLSFQEYQSKNFLYNILYQKYIRRIEKINLSMCFEHLPSNNSKVTLSKNFDKNGTPKINLNTEIDQKNISLIEDSYKYYINILNNIKIGKSVFKKNDFKISLESGNHHHGGLNFGNENTPVTKDFSLQNFKNLYINGSALFPTSSIYGPTLTIIACSYLLYDVIRKRQKL